MTKLGIYKHNKTGVYYEVSGTAINTTNSVDGQVMVCYDRAGKSFVREEKEFHEKFTRLTALGKDKD